MRPQPSREEFDAMTDTQFTDWWDRTVEMAQAEATSEAEVEEACEARDEAFTQRWEA